MNGGGGGLDRLVSSGVTSVPHAMMQANESLYIGEFDLEPLQMTTQIQLPDMEALRLRSNRMGSPPAQLHHLMPPSHQLMPGAGHHQLQQHTGDSVHDQLRLLQPSNSGLSPVSSNTLTTMKYPGTPPDTPPCSSSPSPHYQMTSVTTTVPTATIGLTDVTELVWRGYNQDQALDLRGQCDLTGGRSDKLGEAGTWLSMEYVDTEDPNNLRHCTTVISALPPTSSPDHSLGDHHGGRDDLSQGGSVGGGGCIDDVQVDEVTQANHDHVLYLTINIISAGHTQCAGTKQETSWFS